MALVDLTHTGRVVDAHFFPLAIGYLAASVQRAFGDTIKTRLFKLPAALNEYLLTSKPTVAAFSNYMWNERLQLTFASAVKARDPQVVTIFGGPNYPIDVAAQESWLRARPEIDFYIDGEGEIAFVRLLEALRTCGYDVSALKAARPEIPNLHYIDGDAFIRNATAPRTLELDEDIPSPYLSGIMDEFFEGKLTPLLQTSRGCPYSCTFCHDGIPYMTKTRRFSQARIDAELAYACERTNVPGLCLADLNWGMFPEDIETAKTLARLKVERGWPTTIGVATAKNQKQRVIEMTRILGDSMFIGASIQSTDPDVLKNIKRSNIGYEAIVAMAKESKQTNTPTYTEIILGIPGDTKEKHTKSVSDMIDAGIQDIRSYQFILLPGTDAAEPASREKYRYETRFRVLPRCFGRYTIFDREVAIAETHEVCVGTATLPHADYLECRGYDLTASIFQNGSVVEELNALADVLGARRSAVLARIHALATAPESPLREVYDAFRVDEERNHWHDREEMLRFIATTDGFDRYLSGEYGENQIFHYRTVALATKLPEIVAIAAHALREELQELIDADPVIDRYIDELRAVILARRSELLDPEKSFELSVHFDFAELAREGFAADPRLYWRRIARPLRIAHTEARLRDLGAFFRQFEQTPTGLMYFLQRHPAQMLYREIVDEVPAAKSA